MCYEFPEGYVKLRSEVGFADTTGSARKWWEAFEAENLSRRPDAVVELANQLRKRKATVTELFLAFVYYTGPGGTNIAAVLAYMDMLRAKKGTLFRPGDMCFYPGTYVVSSRDETIDTGDEPLPEVGVSVEHGEVELNTGNTYPLFQGAVCYWKLRS